MGKFVFIVPPLTGHINPTLSVGAELLDRGHQVGWISLDENLGTQLPEGGQLLLIRYDQNDQEKNNSEQYLDIITKKIVYGIESIKFLYEEVLVPLNRHMFDGIVAQLDLFAPDVVINDHQLFAGAAAAYLKGIPYATSVTAPAAVKMMEDLPKIHEWEINQIIELQKELGIEEIKSVACSELLTMVFTSQAFFGNMELPGYYHFPGPVISHRKKMVAFDWNKFNTSNAPKILISIGTTFDHEYKKDFFSKVVEAFGGENLQVVLVSDPDLFEQWPANFIVQSRVPQLDLLPHLNAVICHAGHNTVSETLYQGLPLVVIPIAYDQSHVAGRVVATGCGVRLNYRRFRAHHLKDAVREILSEPAYKKAAEEIGRSFKESGGTTRAAELLESLVLYKEAATMDK
ncbi:glycosyltransferase [Dyadobacter frigoris]|uniref:Glycosyl transferase n=1 Tax=Dyadobacter frigoris TaxID=2576211 RepID=A0A4U6CXL5_9BACT|nr:nucleotide disphospho-sugar-binding domain-containing protein [Dyadobacter frigoris]TKT87968.1 glycosyl transferase [Dyadobacter frigoris]GLU52864.1 glycosyl transferase [Dyadobacter frigoris]